MVTIYNRYYYDKVQLLRVQPKESHGTQFQFTNLSGLCSSTDLALKVELVLDWSPLLESSSESTVRILLRNLLLWLSAPSRPEITINK